VAAHLGWAGRSARGALCTAGNRDGNGGNRAGTVVHAPGRRNAKIGPAKGLPARGGPPTLPAMDKLEEIFSMQDALNKRIGVNLPPPTDEEKAKWILNYTRAMQQETAELIDSVPWKWWAKYQKFDEQNAKVEVVDLFHFLVSLAQTLGMTADDVYQAYLKKNQVNHQRQESGYVKKDEADSKHI
jgi:dimeric dUTPase (all-alpha-NTP-PPase superfamily)